jgi:inosose dehydratase
MESTLDRRDFAKAVALGLGVAAAIPALKGQQNGQAAPTGPKNVKIGVSTLAWNVNTTTVDTFEDALRDISELGYSGYETVSGILEAYDANGMLPKLMDKYHITLKAGYLGTNVTDPSVLKDQVAKATSVAKLIKKYGGTYCVIAVNSRRPQVPGGGGRGASGRGGGGGGMGRGQRPPDNFDFSAHKADIVAALNDIGMAVNDVGLGVGLHPHTGTVVEKHDEVYGTMDSVNTKYMKFAPDVGMLTQGGSDAAQIVKDFSKIVTHMHLKDVSYGKYMGGFCPLGMGIVDIPSILDTLETANLHPDVMYELDRGNAPMSARACAEYGKAYLERIGYKFPMA